MKKSLRIDYFCIFYTFLEKALDFFYKYDKI